MLLLLIHYLNQEGMMIATSLLGATDLVNQVTSNEAPELTPAIQNQISFQEQITQIQNATVTEVAVDILAPANLVALNQEITNQDEARLDLITELEINTDEAAKTFIDHNINNEIAARNEKIEKQYEQLTDPSRTELSYDNEPQITEPRASARVEVIKDDQAQDLVTAGIMANVQNISQFEDTRFLPNAGNYSTTIPSASRDSAGAMDPAHKAREDGLFEQESGLFAQERGLFAREDGLFVQERGLFLRDEESMIGKVVNNDTQQAATSVELQKISITQNSPSSIFNNDLSFNPANANITFDVVKNFVSQALPSEISPKLIPANFTEQSLMPVTPRIDITNMQTQYNSSDTTIIDGYSARLKIHPPELGEISAEIVLNNGKASLNIQVENVSVKNMLENQLHKLHDSLNASDLSLKNINIREQASEERQNAQERADRYKLMQENNAESDEKAVVIKLQNSLIDAYA
jgi:flagellar hook-length control protein FliK